MKQLFILVFISVFFANFSFAENSKADTIKMQNIDEVVISASRTNAKLKELPAKVEVITKKVISQSGAKDLAYLLKNNTSIDLIQYPGFLSGIGMRGFAPGTSNKYVSVFMGGVPVGTANMSTLSLSGVQQVEILKGPFSSLYGSQAMGGIINIVPVQNKGDITGNVSLGYGSYETMNGAVAVGGRIVGGLSFDLDAYYHKQGDDYKIGEKNYYDRSVLYETILDKKSYGAEKKNTTEKSMGGNLRLGYDFNENWSLDIYGNFFRTDDLATGGDIWSNNEPSFKDMDRYGTRISLKGKVKNHLFTFNPYYSKEYNGYLDIETKKATYESELQTYGFQLQDILSLGKHKLTFGIDNQQGKKEVGSFTAEGISKAPSSPGYVNNTLGVFAQANLTGLKDRLIFSAGARYDYMDLSLEADPFLKNKEQSEKHSVFSPNVGLRFKIDEHTSLHSSYGKAFLAPDAFMKAGKYTGKNGTTKGNPDLKPETSNTFDIGLGYNNISQGVNIDVTYFHTNHKDFIIRDNSNKGYTTYKNVSEAQMRGIEVMASYDFGVLADYAFSLKAYFNGTFMLKTKVLEKKWEEMREVRNQTVNFGLQFMTEEKWNIRLNGRYLGSRIEKNWNKGSRPNLKNLQPFYDAKGLLGTPQFLVFDASLFYNISKNFTVGVNANNILDENYTEKDGYNMQGRNFLGKVIFKF